jgi:hypothetical protein
MSQIANTKCLFSKILDFKTSLEEQTEDIKLFSYLVLKFLLFMLLVSVIFLQLHVINKCNLIFEMHSGNSS